MAFSVTLEFRPFAEMTLHDLYDEVGVYVFWNSSAITIPSYIGEGHILSRFTSHLDKAWARRPLAGFIAIVHDGTELERKAMAEFGEMALLDVSKDIFGGLPTHNRQEGKERGIERLRQRWGPSHRRFHVRVEGRDPLAHPSRASRSVKRVVTYEEDEDGYYFDHSWRARRQ